MSEPEQKRARQEARAECRAAARAAERANWLGHSDEINKLLAQINEIDRDPDVITTTEYKLITARLRQREQQSKTAFASQDDKEVKFTCIVCLEKHKLSALRLHVPCGHGFCDKCIAQGTAVPGDDGVERACCTCRQPVEEVIQAFINV